MTSVHPTLPGTWRSFPLLRWSTAIVAAVLAGVAGFYALHIPIFAPVGLPHEVCYVQDRELVWVNVSADAMIGLAYCSIALTLGYLVYRASHDIPFHWVFLAFGLFIISCGFTHFMEIWVTWRPVYWLSAYIKTVTAAASLATAIALFPLLPRIFGLIGDARSSTRHRREIERLNEDLERFNYSVAHDLRAPLRSISGFALVLKEDHGATLPPDAIATIERIEKSAARMDALVTGLLRYATIGRQEVDSRPVALNDALRGALALLEREIADRSATIKVASRLPVVRGDPTLVQAVLQNLLGNSMKFVAPGVKPQIDITFDEDGEDVVLHVIDNGVGFPAEARHRVFGMFERFHREHPGTGIGLAIVQRAVERMRGSVMVEPRPDAPGSCFHIRLPRA